MSLPRPVLRIVAVAAALVLALAACGGDDDTASSGDTTTTASTEAPASDTTEAEEEDEEGSDDTTTTTEAEEEDDSEAQAQAEAVVLNEFDFGPDWEATEPSDDDRRVANCFRDIDLDSALLAEAFSPTFSQEDPEAESVVGVSSTGMVLEGVTSATIVIEEASTNAFAGCALDLLLEGFEEEGLTVGEADLSPAGDSGGIGEQTAVLNGFFSLSGGGQTLDGELSLWFVRTDAIITGFVVFDIGDTEFALVVDEVAAIVAELHETNI